MLIAFFAGYIDDINTIVNERKIIFIRSENSIMEGTESKWYISGAIREILNNDSRNKTIALILLASNTPSNTPKETPIVPIIIPWTRKIDWIVFFEKPRDINIAMSFCLLSTNNDREDIILKDAIAIIRARIINITLFSFPMAWNNALWVSVQLLDTIEYSSNNSRDIFNASKGSDNLSFIYS